MELINKSKSRNIKEEFHDKNSINQIWFELYCHHKAFEIGDTYLLDNLIFTFKIKHSQKFRIINFKKEDLINKTS